MHNDPHTSDQDTSVDMEAMRERLVQELELWRLPQSEQDDLILNLSEVLMERATMNIFSHISSDDAARIDALIAEGKQEEANDIMIKCVPQAAQITEQAIMDGIKEYKQRIAGTYQQVQYV